uniref:Thioredoxin domain-containing protein n=1 Tax=Leersia perrieri TaxID=77586 RepID=A0A0D9VCF8_9ORYZ
MPWTHYTKSPTGPIIPDFCIGSGAGGHSRPTPSPLRYHHLASEEREGRNLDSSPQKPTGAAASRRRRRPRTLSPHLAAHPPPADQPYLQLRSGEVVEAAAAEAKTMRRHLHGLLSRALAFGLPAPPRPSSHLQGITEPGAASRFGAAFLARALAGPGLPAPRRPRTPLQRITEPGAASRFGAVFLAHGGFSTDASAAAQDSVKPAAGTGGEGGDGKSGKSEQGDAGKSVRGGPVSWLSFFLLLLTGGGIIVYYDKEKKRHIEELKNRTSAVKQEPPVGTAAIGGPFNLLNHDGKPVTEKDFLGKWTLLYFGFTHCPDICPDELQKMALAIDKIKEKAKMEIVPVFITVDPERDTVEQVRDYINEFHPDLIGLTGTSDEIRKVARAYRVYYMKTEEEGSDYLVDHSIVMYLMNPKMEFVKFYGKNHDADSLADGIIKEIKEHRSR